MELMGRQSREKRAGTIVISTELSFPNTGGLTVSNQTVSSFRRRQPVTGVPLGEKDRRILWAHYIRVKRYVNTFRVGSNGLTRYAIRFGPSGGAREGIF
jgi:hypothetical protein